MPMIDISGWILTLPGVDWDHRTQTQGIFRITGNGKKGWSRRVDTELGNYDYLLGKAIIVCT